MNAPFSSMSGRFAGMFHKKKDLDVPAVLSAPRRFPYGQFEFHIAVPPHREYQVQASTDLRNWTPVVSDLARAQTVEFLDTTAANFSFRYYRVRCGEQSSVNVLGYAVITVPPGFSMIANPLNAPNNRVEALFPGMAEGTTLAKFDTHLFKLTKNEFAGGKWSNAAETLVPGEGAILFNPTSIFKKLALVGEVSQGDLSIPIPAGFSVRSSMVPLPGQLDTDLLFPAAEDDVIHVYDRDRQQYVVYSFNSGKWTPEPPLLGVGESFWVGKTSAGNWNRTLNLGATDLPGHAGDASQ